MLKQILEEFLNIEGVSAAALVGRDGFVIEMARATKDPDMDAFGAASSSLLRSFDRGGQSLQMGPSRSMVAEYQNGILVITPVTPEEFLAILADRASAVGSLTYSVVRNGGRIAAAM